jgi:hypothetical protein
MVDYSKGKIYTIRYSLDDSLVYVGSTVNDLSQRWWQHKSNHTKKNMKLYKKMCETNDLANWYIELYEEFPCQNKNQLTMREGQIIRKIGTLNHKIEGRTTQEYNKKYHQDNKDYLHSKYSKKVDCSCGGHYTYFNKGKHELSRKHKQWSENK